MLGSLLFIVSSCIWDISVALVISVLASISSLQSLVSAELCISTTLVFLIHLPFSLAHVSFDSTKGTPLAIYISTISIPKPESHLISTHPSAIQLWGRKFRAIKSKLWIQITKLHFGLLIEAPFAYLVGRRISVSPCNSLEGLNLVWFSRPLQRHSSLSRTTRVSMDVKRLLQGLNVTVEQVQTHTKLLWLWFSFLCIPKSFD